MPLTKPIVLRTSAGDFPLHEYRVCLAGREWAILHTGAILTHAEEADYFQEFVDRLPYGVALWPSAIALAHEVASRPEEVRLGKVLELGAGTGLPGIIAASLGAQVVQTDRHEVALSICKCNGERNGISGITYRLLDWADWNGSEQYDWILGSDVLYGDTMHPHLRRIFEQNLAPTGRILLTDPFRHVSLRLLETLEEDGWGVQGAESSVGDQPEPRSIGLFELTRRPHERSE